MQQHKFINRISHFTQKTIKSLISSIQWWQTTRPRILFVPQTQNNSKNSIKWSFKNWCDRPQEKYQNLIMRYIKILVGKAKKKQQPLINKQFSQSAIVSFFVCLGNIPAWTAILWRR